MSVMNVGENVYLQKPICWRKQIFFCKRTLRQYTEKVSPTCFTNIHSNFCSFFSPRYFTDIHFNFCLHQHTASHINRKFFTIITFPPTSLQAVYKKSFECKNVKNVILSKKELQVNYLSLIESKSTDFQEFLIFNLFTVDWSNFLKMRLMRNFALRQSLLRMRTTTKSFNVARFSN